MYLHLLPFLRYIPRGKVTTYGDLASFFGLPQQARLIGQLLGDNTELDTYPCYKVVGSNGELTGYAGGLRNKEERLTKDDIIVKNGSVHDFPLRRWQPRLHSFFLAWPLDENNCLRFHESCKAITRALSDPSVIRFQQTDTPHVTLFYFGDIGVEKVSKIVTHLRAFEKNRSSSTEQLQFSSLSFFGQPQARKVGFFHCHQNEKEGIRFQEQLIRHLGEKKERPFVPHLTFFRVNDARKFHSLEQHIQQHCRAYTFTVQTSLVRLYGAVGEHRQIPLIDFCSREAFRGSEER